MNRIALLVAVIVCGIFPLVSSAQQADGVSGVWTYRSFRNVPELVGGDEQKALALIFGEGILRLDLNSADRIGGTIEFGEGYVLDISGQLQPGSGLIVFKGTGRAGTPTAGWIYDYQAFSAPRWSNGVNQRPALLGTVIRSAQHGGALAGYTASFIAVKTD